MHPKAAMIWLVLLHVKNVIQRLEKFDHLFIDVHMVIIIAANIFIIGKVTCFQLWQISTQKQKQKTNLFHNCEQCFTQMSQNPKSLRKPVIPQKSTTTKKINVKEMRSSKFCFSKMTNTSSKKTRTKNSTSAKCLMVQ